MSIKYRRPELVALKPLYKQIRDVLKGPKAVKDAGIEYLPMPNTEKDDKANKARYLTYKQRAQFYNACARTLDGLVGQIFYRDPVMELPAILEPLIESVDGGELSLYQQSKESSGVTLSLGHGCLLTDYPETARAATRKEMMDGRVRATITLYYPEQIINWRWSTLGAKKFLSLLVLEETYDKEDDGYEAEKGTQWREFRIEAEEGMSPRLHCMVWREGDQGFIKVQDFYPRKGNGQPWDIIPVSFMGAVNNDPIPDRPPFEDMSHINIGHYRNSADYEESCFMVGQPTPWAAGLTESWVKEVWEGELRLGSSAVVPLPEGGSFGLAQAAPNTMPKEAMEIKERQMVALGAKLVEQSQVQRTATEAGQENVVESSVLSTVAQNVSSAYRKAIGFALEYMNSSDKFEFELNTDFEIARMSAQERQQLLTEWQGGGITWEEYRWNLKRSGVAYEDDKKAKTQIENDASLNLGGTGLTPGEQDGEESEESEEDED